MLGKVIDGAYLGSELHRVPEQKVMFLRTKEGENIVLNSTTAVAVGSVENPEAYNAQKALRVIWKDGRESIIQIGRPAPAVPATKPTEEVRDRKPRRASAQKSGAADTYCRECGGKLPRNGKTCPECGCPVKKTGKKGLLSRLAGAKGSRKKIMVIAAVCIALLAATLIINDNILYGDDKVAYEIVVEAAVKFKDPSSVRLVSGMLGVDKDCIFCGISATNGFGARTTSYYFINDSGDITEEDGNNYLYTQEGYLNVQKINKKLQAHFN